MNIFVSGLSYKDTPNEIKEKLKFTNAKKIEILEKIKKIDTVKECIILDTKDICEIYVYSTESNFNVLSIEEIMCKEIEIDIYKNRKYFYSYYGQNAVKHLFKIASDLNSFILSKDKILDNIKTAYFLAKENKFIDIILNKLFIEATTISKKVETATSILLTDSSSIASLAIKYIDDKFKNILDDKNILIIGTDKTGLIMLNNLKSYSFKNIYITDESGKNFDEIDMSKSLLHTIEYNNRYSVIDEADIIITSIVSPYYALTKDLFEENIKTDKYRLILNLSNQNDIDNTISSINNTESININELENIALKNWNIGETESIKSDVMIEKHVYEFGKWYEFRNFLPMLKNIQLIANEIIDKKTLECFENLDNLSDSNQIIVKEGIKKSVYEIINTFVDKIKTLENSENAKNHFSNLSEFFKDSKIE
jgi:glutamyl-tRNA reductase